MFRFTTVCLCAGLCLAQGAADKPPAGVEEALRARINQYFQLLVDNKYRQAEDLVAEDSRDLYYNANKPKYVSFELKTIDYSDNFTRANASLFCETLVVIPGFAGRPIRLPVTSRWKLVNGEWFYYIDPDDVRRTPFGLVNPGSGPPGALPPLPANPGFAMGKVKADKTVVTLKPGQSTEVTLSNAAQGQMSISLTGRVQNVDVKLDRVNLNVGEKAVLSLQAHEGAHSGTLSIQVEQTNEVIPIQVVIE